MRKSIVKSVFLLGISFLISCNNNKSTKNSDSDSGESANKEVREIAVNESEVESSLVYLASDELEGRKTGTEGIKKAAIHIEEIFEENNIQPYFETYRDSFEIQGEIAYNLLGVVEGIDPDLKDEFIIVGAHYDHIGEGEAVDEDIIANGANDNAAGTVAVVELAKYFSNIADNKRSLLFILFSAEELGLQGSKQSARKLKEEGMDVYAMVNLEMIGLPMPDKDYLAYLTGYENSNMAEKFNEYTGEEILGFLPQAEEYDLFRRSDNFPFYQEFDIPAQTISTFDFTNYEYYHHVSDEAQELDIEHMVNVIEKVAPGIHKMANTTEKEIKLDE